ncbi:MAG: class I SAM-dependent methyltransferase [Eubacteriales bacterium]|nr:class I SAM-dependent methyltransferase [Eubacteriales bacterium]
MNHYFTAEPPTGHQEKTIQFRQMGIDFTFVTDQSVFSRQRLDYGSACLLEAVERDDQPKTGRLLDLGCGYGALGIILKRLHPALAVVMCDINKRAVALTRRNADINQTRFVDVVESDGMRQVEGTFDLIVTNPPIRAGKETVHRFFQEASERLNPAGSLFAVIRKQQGAPSALKRLQELFGEVSIVSRSAGYWVIKCVKEA